MAVRIAAANGDWDTAATWKTVDATSLLDNQIASTALTTSYVESATFTPGAITVDGVAVKVAARASSPSGTISVRIAQGGGLVAGTEVTINASDVESRDGEQGWYLFKFSAPVTLLAATLYTVSAKCSVNSDVTLYRNGTAGNWARMLRTTSTGVPASGDSLHILGEWTAAATKTDRTVTLSQDNSGSIQYGNNTSITTSNPAGFTIGKGGAWVFDPAASTWASFKTTLIIWVGGTVTMTPVAATGYAGYDHVCASNGQFGTICYGTLTATGNPPTAGKNVIQAKLTSNLAVAGTTVNLDRDTGWLNGMLAAIAPTNRTYGEFEGLTLSGNAGASSFTSSAGATYAHAGAASGPLYGEVVLQSFQCWVANGGVGGFGAYLQVGAAATVALTWIGLFQMGSSIIGTRGVEVNTTVAASGSATFRYCGFQNATAYGLVLSSTCTGNVSVRDCVFVSCGAGSSQSVVLIVSATPALINTEFQDCTIIGATGQSSTGFNFLRIPTTLVNLSASGCRGSGIYIGHTSGVSAITASGIVGHSNGDIGATFEASGGRVDDIAIWRNDNAGSASLNNPGLNLNGSGHLLIDGGYIFGQRASNIFTWVATCSGHYHLRNLVIASDTTFSTLVGYYTQDSAQVIFENCTFGVATGIFAAHATADVDGDDSIGYFNDVVFRNTVLGSGTEVASGATDSWWGRSCIRYQRKDGVTGTHETFYPRLGTVARSTSTYNTSSPSEKLTPSGAVPVFRLRSSVKRVMVSSGSTPNVSVYVRKDGSYTGSAPRLVILSNAALGLDDDLVLATMAGAANLWEQLSGDLTPAAEEDGVLECVVEVDGSAGNVYVDDWEFV